MAATGVADPIFVEDNNQQGGGLQSLSFELYDVSVNSFSEDTGNKAGRDEKMDPGDWRASSAVKG